jgi:hypothetical protein
MYLSGIGPITKWRWYRQTVGEIGEVGEAWLGLGVGKRWEDWQRLTKLGKSQRMLAEWLSIEESWWVALSVCKYSHDGFAI